MPELVNLFPILFVIVLAVIAVVFVVVMVSIVASARRARQAGHNPLTLQTDIATKLLDSEALSPERSTQERLATLEELHQTHVISADEYKVARARVLADH